MISRRAVLLLVLLCSVVFRIAIFYPRFFPNVDAAEFATFVREISMNSGMVPHSNAIYFPGSRYIYPPLLFLFTYYVDIPVRALLPGNNFVGIYTLLAIAIASGAVMNYVIYRNVAKDDSSYSKILAFTVPVFFGVDIYALTWGGFPYIVDSMFFVLLLFLLDKETWKSRDYAYAVLLSVAIPLTHDLTWFVMAGSMLVIIIFNAIKRRNIMVRRSLLVLSVTAAVGLAWWLPRLNFLLGVISLNQASGAGILSPVGSGALTVALAVPYAIPIIFLVLLELLGSLKAGRLEKVDSFTLVLATTGAGLVFLLKDPVLTARIVLYSYTMLMIIVLKNIHTVLPLKDIKFRGKEIRKAAKAAAILFVVIGIPSQFFIGTVSSGYYSSGGFSYDQGLVSWASENVHNGTIAAPEIGNYISAVAGSQVIIYSGFLVGTHQIEQRNAVIQLLLHPDNQSTQFNVSKYNIRYLVISNSMVNSTLEGHFIDLQQAPFTFLHKFQSYSVYYVSYG